jgi:hypothetical protein
LSVGEVVVDAGAVVVVPLVPLLVDVDPDLSVVVVVAPEPGAVVVVVAADPGAVVVVVVAGGATKATVSPRMVAALVEGVADSPVHPRAAFQLWSAVAAGVPLRGWGSPARIVAGRNTTPVMWRPSAVRMREPLLVSGAASS